MVHGGVWIGYLHQLAPHQLSSPNWPTPTSCTCKRCNVANINSSWNFEVIDLHKRVILTAQFVSNLWCWLGNKMMTASCTGYRLTIFEYLLQILSHLDHVFFVNAKENNWFHFFLTYFQHRTIVQNLVVEWSLQTSFCRMAFHRTTDFITPWFPVVSCKENLLCFYGKVLFRGAYIKEVLKSFILRATTIRNVIDLCDVREPLFQEFHQ